MGNTLNEPVVDKEFHEVKFSGCGEFVSCGMQGYRLTMEDKHLMEKIPNTAEHYILGIFDGHAGNVCAEYISANLVNSLVENETFKLYTSAYTNFISSEFNDYHTKKGFFEMSVDILKKAFVETWVQLDTNFRNLCATSSDGSGTTAVVVLITPFHYFCVNVGDSRAVLGIGRDFISNPSGYAIPPSISEIMNELSFTHNENTSSMIDDYGEITIHDTRRVKITPLEFGKESIFELSSDHKPNNPLELERIKKAGGFVNYNRVNGELALSRAFGDFTYKHVHLEPQNMMVTCHPDIVVRERDPSDDFIILACDGIWDVIGSEEAINYIRGAEKVCFSLNEVTSFLVDEAFFRGSKDNISAIVGRLYR